VDIGLGIEDILLKKMNIYIKLKWNWATRPILLKKALVLDIG